MKNLKVDPLLYPFQSHYLTLPAGSLHYIDEGPKDPQTPVLFMLHGNPTWSFYYRNVVKSFKKYFRCIAIDHMGCGGSDRPQHFSYTLESHIQNAMALIDFLQLKKISLLVHDWGGAIGMGVATRRPELVDKIVLMNTAAFFMDRIPKRISICRQGVIGKILVRGLNGFAYPATFMATSKGLPRKVKEGYLAPYSNWKDRVAVHGFVKDIPMEPSHPTRQTLMGIEQKLVGLRNHPVLVLWGGQDFCFNDRFYQKWEDILPQAEKKYFKDAGHYVLEDKTQDCLEAMSHFLTGDQ